MRLRQSNTHKEPCTVINFNPLHFLALSIVLLATSNLSAEDKDSDDIEAQQSSENIIVTTASRTEQSSRNLALSITAISENELNLINHTHIQESLNRIPGVNFHRGDGQEYLPSIRSQVFTGAGACGALLIMEDNIPLRPMGLCNINELFEANTELASRMEVIRGPGTVFYGSNAIHGVVNVITPAPEEGGQVSLEVGENGLYRSKLSTGSVSGDHGFNLSAVGASYGGWRDESSYDQQKIALRHEYSGADWRVTSGLSSTNLNQETAGFVVGEDAYLDRALSATNNDTEGFRDVNSLRLWSRIETSLSSDADLTITPYIRSSDMTFMMHFLPGDPVEENGQESVGIQSNYQVSVNDSLIIRSGIDFEMADTYLKQTQENPTPGSAFLQATIPAGKQYDYTVDTQLLSLFTSIENNLSESTTLNAGVRWETLEYDYTNRMNSGRLTESGEECGFGGCRYSRPESSVNDFDNWSADIGFITDISETNQVFARVTRAYRAPQATELYRLQRNQAIADLESEQVNAVELGFRGSHDSLSYEVTAYLMRKNNFIFRDVDFFNVSDGKTKHSGLETALSYTSQAGYYWNASISYASHKYDYDEIQSDININGNDIDTAPKLHFNQRLGWANDLTKVELEWIKADGYFLEPTNRFSYPGHDLWHLLVSHALNNHWDMSIRVHNLLDEKYAERADYTGFTAYRYFPGIPRQASLTLRYRW